jgi:hypothetical protein
MALFDVTYTTNTIDDGTFYIFPRLVLGNFPFFFATVALARDQALGRFAFRLSIDPFCVCTY